MDARVKEVQIWLNTTYVNKNGYILVDEDGLTGNETVQALMV